MLLSIIIPIFNTDKYVEQCIRSCETQDISSSEYEIICVNDGSTDNSLEIISHMAEKYDNIKVISQKNRGLSAARNIGMHNALGDYYMFVDSDDWIANNCLSRIQKKLIEEEPDALAICAADYKNGEFIRRQSYQDETIVTGTELLRRGVSPCAPFSIWRAGLLKDHDLSFFEGIYHEDSEFTPRAYYYAKKVSFIDEIIYFVFQNPTSITRSVNPKKSFDYVQIVCSHLSSFSKLVPDEDKVIFYNLIGENINNAMFHIRYSDNEVQSKFNTELVRHSYLWKDIRKSSIRKYRLEAAIINVFPNHPLRVYKILQFINGR